MPKKLTNEEFLARARAKYGDRYEYLDPYTNFQTPLRIRCKKHDYVFTPMPANFLRKTGCPICANESRKEKLRTPPMGIIALAEQVHGVGRFDYSQVGDFKNIGDIVDIICHKKDADGIEHGVFPQTFRNHIYNHQGCPKCKGESRKKLVFGVGVNDTTIYTHSECYIKWFQMLNRCYNEKSSLNRTYADCKVSDEWLYLSNFAKWFYDHKNGFRKMYHLDKDLIEKGNKIYAPDKCCFLPPEINIIFHDSSSYRGNYPIGVQKRNGKFIAMCSRYGKQIYLGRFETPEEAFYAYKQAKESYIKEVAQAYYDRDEITKKVYDAMFRYKIEITD